MASGQSHFEQSYQELTAVKRGTVGRSANVQELLDGKNICSLLHLVLRARSAKFEIEYSSVQNNFR